MSLIKLNIYGNLLKTTIFYLMTGLILTLLYSISYLSYFHIY